MLGQILLIVFMIAIFPVGFFLSGALLSGVWGSLFSKDADQRHEGSELIELNA
jgi:glycerol-3-phosphate acyltransferase PlsY